MTKMYKLREAEDILEEATMAPAEARQAAKAMDGLLALGRLPAGFRASLAAARTELRKRLPVWGDLTLDGEPEAVVSTDAPPPSDGANEPPAAETTEAALAGNFEGLPLTEATSGPGEFRVRIIRPGWGSSGYYSKATLVKASESATFPKGLKMYWNHPTKSEDRERPERDLRDLAGELAENARWEEAGTEGPGLYARIKTFGPYQGTIKELAPHIGVSIRGAGSGHLGEAEGKQGRIIEAIVGAKSVDFVTAPGAGGKVIELFESARDNQEDGMDLQEATAAKNVAEARVRELEEAQRTATEEVARLREAMASTEAARVIGGKLAAVKLPDATKARLTREVALRATLVEGKLDEAALTTALDEAVTSEIAYLESILGKGRISGMGGDAGEESTTASVKEAQESLGRSFAAFGLSEAASKRAVTGRG